MIQPILEREFVYERESCIPFRKVTDPFGKLSNMSGGFPLVVNGVTIATTEALYQSFRFTHLPDIQKVIIEQDHAWNAKRKSRVHLKESRADWTLVRVPIMEWVQRIKLAQHFEEFSALLLSTNDMPIVEESMVDGFWGATRSGNHALVGSNVLGRILTKLRMELRQRDAEEFWLVEPPAGVPEFLLYGSPVHIVQKKCVTA